MAQPLLEVCIDSIASALAAEQGGAHRLEVCSSLSAGGTTPSHGLIEQCRALTQLPLMVMIRPHDGTFVYSDDDVQTMLRDIDVAKQLGAQGVVFGALAIEGTVDVATTARLIAASRPLEVTFHRAFDVCSDPVQTLDVLMELGVDRLLTSGQARTAEQGVSLIERLVKQSAGRIVILAGSGINATNARAIMEAARVEELHASASEPDEPVGVQCASEVSFGEHRRSTSADIVRAIVRAMG